MIKGKRSTLNGASPSAGPAHFLPQERKLQREQQGPTCLISERTETEKRLFYGQYERKEKEATRNDFNNGIQHRAAITAEPSYAFIKIIIALTFLAELFSRS